MATASNVSEVSLKPVGAKPNEPSNKWREEEVVSRVIDLSDVQNPRDLEPLGGCPFVVAPQQQNQVERPQAAEKIHGKPVLYRNAKTVLNMASDFVHKLLCTGPVLNLGDACAYSCAYCYVGPVVHKLNHELLDGRAHQNVVIRRRDALGLLREQLQKNKERDSFHIVFSSSLVDIAATMEFVKETAIACTAILENTVWDIRLLTKSNFLPQVIKLIPEEYHQRLILGVSTGTFDDELGKVIEKGTALVSKRIESLHWLQDHGFRTFAMVCPSLPQENYAAFAEQARVLLRYDRCEHVWCEVVNLRGESFAQTIKALDDAGRINDRDQLARVCGEGSQDRWEAYARATFEAHAKAVTPEKLRFLQYLEKKEHVEYWKAQQARGAVLLGRYGTKNKKVQKVLPADRKPLPKALIVEGDANKIRELLEANVGIVRRSKKLFSDWFENGVIIGKHFAQVKTAHPGKYLSYLTTNFMVNRRTANNYVVLYEEQESIRAQMKMGNVSHANGAYQLARRGKLEKKRLAKFAQAPRAVAAGLAPTEAQPLLKDRVKPEVTPKIEKTVELGEGKAITPVFNIVKTAGMPVFIASVPEMVLAELSDVIKRHAGKCQHQVIREDGEITLNRYFSDRLGLTV